mmetsp:Transcript_22247/g.63828  ORF Transcript_22247/g.63828 Transcript_22247/m.63828 type:complete len:225 (-) Transcript_22247:470-1144(-)
MQPPRHAPANEETPGAAPAVAVHCEHQLPCQLRQQRPGARDVVVEAPLRPANTLDDDERLAVDLMQLHRAIRCSARPIEPDGQCAFVIVIDALCAVFNHWRPHTASEDWPPQPWKHPARTTPCHRQAHLVPQVVSDYMRALRIPRRQHAPVLDPMSLVVLAPRRLRTALGEPHAITLHTAGPRPESRVIVQDHCDLLPTELFDHLVHDLNGRQCAEMRVQIEVD